VGDEAGQPIRASKIPVTVFYRGARGRRGWRRLQPAGPPGFPGCGLLP